MAGLLTDRHIRSLPRPGPPPGPPLSPGAQQHHQPGPRKLSVHSRGAHQADWWIVDSDWLLSCCYKLFIFLFSFLWEKYNSPRQFLCDSYMISYTGFNNILFYYFRKEKTTFPTISVSTKLKTYIYISFKTHFNCKSTFCPQWIKINLLKIGPPGMISQ